MVLLGTDAVACNGHGAMETEHHLANGDSPGGGSVNYTFTDNELQSLLSSLDQGTPFEQELLGGGASASLQFLPHLPTSHAGPDAAAALLVPTDLTSGLSLDVGTAHLHHPLPLLPLPGEARPAAAAVGAPEAQHQQLAPQLPPVPHHQNHQKVHIHQPPAKQRQQRPGRAAVAAAAAAAAAAGKQPHSQVEKQRRDRINFLIDELRELVPPQTAYDPPPAADTGGSSGGDCRRPKHLVLSDTIRLIKQLQLQVVGQQHWSPSAAAAVQQEQHWAAGEEGQAGETAVLALPVVGAIVGQEDPHRQQQEQQQQQQQQQQQGAGMDGVEAACMALDDPTAAAGWQGEPALDQQQDQQGAQQEVEEQQQQQQQWSGSLGTRRSYNHPELPAAPGDDAAAVNGVTVESEGGNIRCVKVICPDRHGLLADVVRALRELPLEITTAAVTTRRDHVVYDVFQVDLQDPSLTSEAISAAVEAVLSLPADKKRRYLSPVASRDCL